MNSHLMILMNIFTIKNIKQKDYLNIIHQIELIKLIKAKNFLQQKIIKQYIIKKN